MKFQLNAIIIFQIYKTVFGLDLNFSSRYVLCILYISTSAINE